MSKKTKSTQNSTGNATTTPQAPGYIQGPVSDYFGQVGGLMNSNTPAWTPGTNANLTRAFTGAQQLGNNSSITDAMTGTQGLMNFSPDSVTNQDAYGLMGNYQNPWEDQVVNNSLNDLDRFRQGTITNNQGAATAAHAFGGSRHGVADAETNRGFLDQAGNLSAQLRSQGFQTALQGAQFDAANRNNANQFNANMGLQGANFRLGAANQLGALGMNADANSRANLGVQAGLGMAQQENDQANDPNQARMRQLQQLQALLGINPAALIGQNVQSNGTQTSTTTTPFDWAGVLGSALQAAGTAYASDRRLKFNIEALEDNINGTPLYRFEYLDEPGVKIVGVMADEAPPHAVVVMDNGFLAVDYGSL